MPQSEINNPAKHITVKFSIACLSVLILMLIFLEGRIMVIFSTIFLWLISSLLGLLVVNYMLSKGFIPNNLRQGLNDRIVLRISAIAVVGLPILASIGFIIGDGMEGDYPIIWGCYLEWFPIGAGILWVFLAMLSGIMLIIGQVGPKEIFSSRIKLILAFLVFNSYSFFMIYIFEYAIKFFAASLNGINRTCF